MTPRLPHHLAYSLAPSDVASVIAVLAKNACDGGCRRFVLTKKNEGSMVAAAGRFALQENQDRNYRVAGSHGAHERQAEHAFGDRGTRLAPDSLVYRVPTALPMGFSWAMFFLSRCHGPPHTRGKC